MIATLRGLAILAGVTLALALAVAWSVTRSPGEVDRALIPGFAAERVTALVWSAGRIERDPKSSTGWSWAHPRAEADQRMVEDILATLRGARWHRERDATREPTGLVVEGLDVRIAAGDVLGEEQQWLTVGDRDVLVDRHIVSSLFPSNLASRIRTPLARAAEAKTIAIDPIVLTGSPRRLGAQLLVDPRPVARLEQALAEITTEGWPTEPVTATGRAVRLDGELVLSETGTPCPRPGLVAVTGPRLGPACIPIAHWQRVAAMADAFAGDPRTFVEPRPAPIEPVKIRLPDGELDLAKRPKLGDADADPTRVAELLAALNTPGEPVARPSSAPIAAIIVTARDATIELERFADRTVARKGEPVALQLTEAAYAILARPARAYRDPTLWAEDASTIRSVVVGTATYTRGVVLGEWSQHADLVNPLVELLARPQSRGDASAPARPIRVELTVEAPTGATKRTLEVGTTASGCAATLAGSHVLVEPRICDLVTRLARK